MTDQQIEFEWERFKVAYAKRGEPGYEGVAYDILKALIEKLEKEDKK